MSASSVSYNSDQKISDTSSDDEAADVDDDDT